MRGAFLCGLSCALCLVCSGGAARAGSARRNMRAILRVNLWSGVLAGYSTGGLAHPRHFGVFDRKQVA